MGLNMRIHLVFLICVVSISASAGDNFNKVHVFQTYYSGKDKQTFSNENPGQGFEVSVSTFNERFNWVAKSRLSTVAGSQKFLDGGTARTLDFTYYQGSFEGGFLLYPLMKKKRSVNLYFGFTGIFSLNHLQFDSTSLTTLQPAYQSTSFGYSGLVGIEWFVADSWCISTEFVQRFETANLAKKSSFDLGGFSLALGFGW